MDNLPGVTCLDRGYRMPARRIEFRRIAAESRRWLLSIQGETFERPPELGHDTQLAGWPWIEGTHSWIEPTALTVVALKAADHASHFRTREAVELLFNRQLPAGGCNCGNTIVLGQAGLPHVQPSGMAMLALSGEPERGQKISRSLSYLKRSVQREWGTASLCWASMGLAAHDQQPANLNDLLFRAFQRTWKQDRSPQKLALLVLASLGKTNSLVSLTLRVVSA